MDVASLSRRDRERLLRRTAMLDAARAVFAEKGYEHATLDEIAERAEFGKGTLYNYFPDGKEEIFFTLFEEVIVSGLERVIEDAFPDPDALTTSAAAREAFRGFIERLFLHFEAQRDAMMIFMKEGHRMLLSTGRIADIAQHWARIMDAVRRPVEAAVRHGALRDLPALPIAHVIMGNVRGMIMAEIDAECDPSGATEHPSFASAAEAAEFTTTILFDGLLPRPTPSCD